MLTAEIMNSTLAKRAKRNEEIIYTSTMRPARLDAVDALYCHACRIALKIGEKIVSKNSGNCAYIRRSFYHLECARNKNII